MEPTKKASVLVDLIKRSLREYAESLILALVIAFFVRAFIFGAYKIPTTTMYPSLLPGDLVIALKWPYLKAKWLPFTDGKIQRGDLVVFKCPDNPDVSCVKRVVGMPGEKISIHQGRLTVDGETFSYKGGQSLDIKKTKGELLFQYVEKPHKEGPSHQIVLSANLNSNEEGEQGPIHQVEVPKDHFYLLGDNREVIDDSREWGPLPKSYIKGRLVRVLLSVDWEDPIFFKKFPGLRSERWLKAL